MSSEREESGAYEVAMPQKLPAHSTYCMVSLWRSPREGLWEEEGQGPCVGVAVGVAWMVQLCSACKKAYLSLCLPRGSKVLQSHTSNSYSVTVLTTPKEQKVDCCTEHYLTPQLLVLTHCLRWWNVFFASAKHLNNLQ